MQENLNIDIEERFIKFLGYKVIGPNNSNRWIILDKNEKQVGFIQYKKIHNRNPKKNLPAVFGYETRIDSDLLSYSNLRREDEDLNENLNYEFDNKDNHIEISFGKYPSITIWSDAYGYMCFNINADMFHFNFKSKTENYNLEETVIVKNRKVDICDLFAQRYSYTLSYCDKDKSLDGKDTNTLEIIFDYHPYYQEQNKMKVEEKRWEKDVFIGQKTTVVEGTIKEAISKHKMGIEAFNHFRYILSQALPFTDDLITDILQDCDLEEEFKLFIPDFEKNSKVKSII